MVKEKEKKLPREPGAEYGPRFRMECKELYLEVRTLNGVIRLLKRRGYKFAPSKSTLAKWRNDEKWDETMRQLDIVVTADLDPADDSLEGLYREVRAMRKIMREKIVKVENGKIRLIEDSATQDAYAYNKLVQSEATLKEKIENIKKAKANSTPIDVIFETLKRYPPFARLLGREDVLADLEALMAEVLQERLMAQVGIVK